LMDGPLYGLDAIYEKLHRGRFILKFQLR